MSARTLEAALTAHAQKVTLGSAAPAAPIATPIDEPAENPRQIVAELQRELEQKARRIEQLQGAFEQLQSRLESAVAERDAARILLEQWREELQQRQAEADASGYREGMEKYEKQWRAEMDQHIGLWRAGIEALSQQHAQHWDALNGNLTDLAMAAIVKILGDQLATPAAIAKGIDHIVRESDELGPLKIRVAPKHYEQLSTLDSLQFGPVRGRHVEILPDSRVEYGGCLLETAGGLVDGRYEMQLARLREILRG